MQKRGSAFKKDAGGTSGQMYLSKSAPVSFLKVHPSDVLHTQIQKQLNQTTPTPSYGPWGKTDITLEKETIALVSNREKWLSRKKKMDTEFWREVP